MNEVPSTLPVVEEDLTITKNTVVTGRVSVRTETETVEEMASADLLTEAVDVVRIPIDRDVDEAPEVRVEGDVTIVPVLEERLVVRTQLVLREEIHIRRRAGVDHVAVPVPLRKQRVVVERSGGTPPDE